ncbi:helix-turn-helix domain-containing protein [Saccharopolyspora griseoalba]|uniref:Helix-turn-helix domain-containing protein n=1 Tax=Saccharopolyspora griseoalba TaxID=1431848 RepID=A0ABW2LPQ8_9PSEU
MPPTSPVVAAWELGIRLREARAESGLKGIAAARELGLSQNFLSDVEHGKRRLSNEKLLAAIELYSVPEQDREDLLGLRDACEQRGWWSAHSALYGPELQRYYGFEWAAQEIRAHESLLIPGLLQTEAYAYALMTNDRPNLRTSEADARVRNRMLRQRRLTDDDPVRFTAVISEAVLMQQVGGPEVLGEQLRHVLDLIEDRPETIRVHVVPFTAGAFGALGQGTINLLDFPSPRVPMMAWFENLTSVGLLDNPARVREYDASFDELMGEVLSRDESADRIHRAIEELA